LGGWTGRLGFFGRDRLRSTHRFYLCDWARQSALAKCSMYTRGVKRRANGLYRRANQKALLSFCSEAQWPVRQTLAEESSRALPRTWRKGGVGQSHVGDHTRGAAGIRDQPTSNRFATATDVTVDCRVLVRLIACANIATLLWSVGMGRDGAEILAVPSPRARRVRGRIVVN